MTRNRAGSVPPSEAPRSLADELRARNDEELGALLAARPDLVSPVPVDVGQLATRATTQTSVTRALDRLDRFTLQTVEVLAALPEVTTPTAVMEWLGADPSEPLARLRCAALVWDAPEGPRLVRTARQLVGVPAGLGPPLRDAVAGYGPRRLAQLVGDLGLPAEPDPVRAAAAIASHVSQAAVLAAFLAAAPAPARELLDRLTWGPPNGRVGDAMRDVTAGSAATPVEWLLARALLVGIDQYNVTLPREVAVFLRGGHVHERPEPEPPPLATTQRDPALVDRTAGGAAFAHVRHVEDLLEAWSLDGPSVLRAGGLGVRDLRRTAAALDLEEEHAAFVVETAYAAGLVGTGGELDELWWPTPAYDAWLADAIEDRWTTLVTSWLATTRVSGLVGSRDERDKVRSALGPDLDRGHAPVVRRAVLDELTSAGAAATAESLAARLAWGRPRRAGRLQTDLVGWTLREAELLGVLGLGAPSTPGRALLAGDADPAGALHRLLPAPLEHILLQADLTAVAPGPLESAFAHELAMVADVESKGGATVYRFTESSVRRALDSGRSASDVHAMLAERSRTPVPQPLTYLVDDVARRHGRIRVGTASAYIRCDDEALLSELVADRRSGQLRLRRLAPSVVAAQAPVDAVLDRLREMGYAPMAETPDGDVVVRRPDARRTPLRQRPPRFSGEPPAPSPTLLGAAVRAIRAGDRATNAVRRTADVPPLPSGLLPRSGTAETLSVLHEAAAKGNPLWIGYVNNDGQATQRVIEPLRVEGGYVSAFDHLRDEVRSFAVHRITGVAAVDA